MHPVILYPAKISFTHEGKRLFSFRQTKAERIQQQQQPRATKKIKGSSLGRRKIPEANPNLHKEIKTNRNDKSM
jgi:hypothetical protein